MENIKIVRIDLEGIQGLGVAVQGNDVLVPLTISGRDLKTYKREISDKVCSVLFEEVYYNAASYEDLYDLAKALRMAASPKRVRFFEEF